MEGQNKIKYILFYVPITLVGVVFCLLALPALASKNNLFINEVQTAGTSSSDEFIELFNPADMPIILDGYKLSKKTKAGKESVLLSSAKFLGTIAAHGYFLIAHPSYKDSVSADLAYSGSSYYLTSDNTVLLYDKSGILLDKVGFGAAADFENAPTPSPADSQSIERKNFADTDNNTDDFSINTSPSPQNSTAVEASEEESQNNDDSDQDEMENNDNNKQDSPKNCVELSKDIKLNEIFPYPESGNEFVEIANIGAGCVNVSGWKIVDEAGHKKILSENSILYPKEYLLLEGNLYLNNDFDTVYLLDTNGNTKDDALDNIHYEKPQKNFSYSFEGKSWYYTTTPTPGIENLITAKSESMSSNLCENNICPEKVFFSEILANPKKDETKREYIEIINKEKDPVDLFGWTIRDASKTAKFLFKAHILLETGKYLTLYRPETKIALNNSDEAVYLFNPVGKLTSSAVWQKAAENISYNFDGKLWHWSKFLTPGRKNKFDDPPTVKVTKPKNINKNIAANFNVSAKDKETKHLKYVWDFGDGHKSYLEDTSHKYLKTGSYGVKLTVSDASQSVENRFELEVKKYPRPKLEIVKLVPNPAGLDSSNETVSLLNASSKKVNLLNYKIATGSDPKKLVNHPITSGLILAPGEVKIITRADSKIVLNNKAGRVALLYPDGKVADEVEYAKEKIEENETYALLDGKWQWILAENKNEIAEAPQDVNEGLVAGTETEKEDAYATYSFKYTLEDYFIFLNSIGFLQNFENENCCQKNRDYPSPAYLLATSL
jgi:hypothetical protein